MNELILRALRLLLVSALQPAADGSEIDAMIGEIDRAIAAWSEFAVWEAEPPPPTTILAGSERDIEAALADK